MLYPTSTDLPKSLSDEAILTVIIFNPDSGCVAIWECDIWVVWGACNNSKFFKLLLNKVVIIDWDSGRHSSPNSRTSREGHHTSGKVVVKIAERIKIDIYKMQNILAMTVN